MVTQFERAIGEGAFSLLSDAVRTGLGATYATLMRANSVLGTLASMPIGTNGWRHAFAEAQRTIESAQHELPKARQSLLRELGHSPDDA